MDQLENANIWHAFVYLECDRLFCSITVKLAHMAFNLGFCVRRVHLHWKNYH